LKSNDPSQPALNILAPFNGHEMIGRRKSSPSLEKEIDLFNLTTPKRNHSKRPPLILSPNEIPQPPLLVGSSSTPGPDRDKKQG
jgi:hypothetical protein